ncbi:hypothetical protein KM043_008183 [Ampulex compressa]|nr:hypothetical protein KM043_008183 [Ampulex compressa]
MRSEVLCPVVGKEETVGADRRPGQSHRPRYLLPPRPRRHRTEEFGSMRENTREKCRFEMQGLEGERRRMSASVVVTGKDGGVHQYADRTVYVGDTEGRVSLECGFDGEARLSISRHVAVEWSRGVQRGEGGWVDEGGGGGKMVGGRRRVAE